MNPVDDPLDGRAPGTRLATERERQGLSRADIAQRLHMSASQVEALETGDYARLPRGTFLRGFVRNYAKLLGIDADALVRSLAHSAPSDARPGIVVVSQNIRFDPLGQHLASPYVKAAGITAAVLVVGFAAMYWWLFVRTAPPAVTVARKTVTADAPKPYLTPAPEALRYAEAPPRNVEAPRVEGPAKAPAAPEVAKPEPAKPGPQKAAPKPAAQPTAIPASGTIDAAPVVAAGGSVIRLKFRGSAWVEIKDGRGKVLLSRNNPGGSEAEVIGKGPFSVVVGNAPEVTMFLNDREFDLEPHTRVAVARFTVQ